jgi:hypothetical protein
VDERGLYRPAAYPSMVAYCIGELRFTEEAARKRIHAARTARRAREEQREATKRAAEAKRAETERRRERDRAEAEAKREEARATKAAESDPGTSVIPWLRSLGLRAEQAKRAAAAVEAMADAPLDARMRAALAFHGRVRFPGAGRTADGMATASSS